MKPIELCPYGDRDVHRVTDTGGVCGGGDHVGSAGCLHRERPGAGPSGQQMVAFLARAQAGEGVSGAMVQCQIFTASKPAGKLKN